LYREAIAEARAIRDERHIMHLVAGLAGMALATDQAERAARLLGAIAAKQDATGFTGVLSDRQVESTVAMTHAALGDEALKTVWEEGRDMVWPDAVANALAVLDPADPAMPPRQSSTPVRAAHDLTERELDVLRLLVTGKSNPEIAEALYIGRGTVRTHVSNILGKLVAKTRTEAAALARERGLI
jgi:DNA-binding NarL/FixJ family response regulator